jgi:hypothetical protein
MDLKKIIGTTILGVGLASSVSAQEGWMNIQTGYDLDNSNLQIRGEGGNEINEFVDMYGFIDLYSGDKSLDSNYGEARVSLDTGNSLGIEPMAEVNFGTGLESKLRLGAICKFSFGEGNFSILKVLPYDSGNGDSQVSLFSSQDIGDFNASILVDYNIDSDTVLVEPSLSYNLSKDLELFTRASSFGKVDNLDFSIQIGAKYDF